MFMFVSVFLFFSPDLLRYKGQMKVSMFQVHNTTIWHKMRFLYIKSPGVSRADCLHPGDGWIKQSTDLWKKLPELSFPIYCLSKMVKKKLSLANFQETLSLAPRPCEMPRWATLPGGKQDPSSDQLLLMAEHLMCTRIV